MSDRNSSRATGGAGTARIAAPVSRGPMIEIGQMGGSGREVMKRLLQDMPAVIADKADFARSITEIDTDFGYCWRYEAAPQQPAEAIIAMIPVAKAVAEAEARPTGKAHLVGATPQPRPALYVFASDHPDACKAAINVMFEFTSAGQRIRRPGPRAAVRH
jgi:hypothetical protein